MSLVEGLSAKERKAVFAEVRGLTRADLRDDTGQIVGGLCSAAAGRAPGRLTRFRYNRAACYWP